MSRDYATLGPSELQPALNNNNYHWPEFRHYTSILYLQCPKFLVYSRPLSCRVPLSLLFFTPFQIRVEYLRFISISIFFSSDF